jgi:hypothetical protein
MKNLATNLERKKSGEIPRPTMSQEKTSFCCLPNCFGGSLSFNVNPWSFQDGK